MKKLFLLSAVFVIAGALATLSLSKCHAQNNLVIFSEQGEQFYVVLNGIKQNVKPETNVKVTSVMQSWVTTKIIFADGKTADLDKKLALMSGGSEVQGYEFVYAVKKTEKGYKLAYRSEAVIAQAPPAQGQTIIVYSATPPLITESTTTTISTTTTGAAPTGDHVNIGMNAPGVNFNMNVNVNDGTTHSGSTTMTSTTTTSSTTTNSGAASSGNVYVLPGYSGTNNCPWPMSSQDFSSAKNSIKAKSFEDSKLTVSKQILGSNCMLSSQVKEIMLVFDFEATRLDFAKFAWGKTFDPGNYYKLNDAFTFESSIEELNEYIEGRR